MSEERHCHLRSTCDTVRVRLSVGEGVGVLRPSMVAGIGLLGSGFSSPRELGLACKGKGSALRMSHGWLVAAKCIVFDETILVYNVKFYSPLGKVVYSAFPPYFRFCVAISRLCLTMLFCFVMM
jgi:hypothetical protein